MNRILLIDDDEDMLMMTGRWLEKAGYDVTKVSSGKEALEKIKQVNPDLVLLDYAMPEMDGPAVLSAIRSDDELKGLKVFFRTGMDDNDMDNGLEPDGIIPKSKGKPELLRVIKENL
jgi:CheY-like chemotaxis protein